MPKRLPQKLGHGPCHIDPTSISLDSVLALNKIGSFHNEVNTFHYQKS